MKNKKLIIILAIVVIMIPIAYNLFSDHTYHLEHATESVRNQALAVLKDNDCMACHSVNSVAPPYSVLPIIGETIKKDMEFGKRSLLLDDVVATLENDGLVGEVDLAKIEHAVDANTMPPKPYTAIHWGANIKKNEAEVIKKWVAHERMNNYKSMSASAEFALEPIRPIETEFAVDANKVALGNQLYHDTRLSANNTISCATCHDLAKGGTDQLPVSIGIHDQEGPINSPTVYNAVYNLAQFWDGRAHDLQAQAAGPPMDAKEMGNNSFDDIVERLSADKELVKQFANLYTEGITQNSITDAIAEFEKTLVTPNAPFDKYLKGDKDAITARQAEGYDVFKRVGCVSCHVGEAIGGQSFEHMGIFDNGFALRGSSIETADKGRAKFTGDEKDNFKQKTPTLRNIALTAPYFHDASANSLEEAVSAMAKYQVKENVTQEEITLITEFLESLTGEYNGQSL